jgi:GNAT superfamily N-acetyltransferase
MLRRWGDVVQVRELERGGEEQRLVLSSWARSWGPHSRPRLEPARVDAVVEDYLARCDRILVAVIPGVKRVVCGWVARLQPGLIGYLYTLHDYRRAGIATRLLREAGIDPRGPRWRHAFGTPRMRRLCRPDPSRPDRVPWNGAPHHG